MIQTLITRRPVLIVLPHRSVGGADRRFIAIASHLSVKNDVYVLVPESLNQSLQNDFDSQCLSCDIKMVPRFWNLSNRAEYKDLVLKVANQFNASAIVVVLKSPFYWFDRLDSGFFWLYSYPMSSIRQLNLFGILALLHSLVSYHHLDILNPSVYKALCAIPGFRKKISLAPPPGLPNVSFFNPRLAHTKLNHIVFVGRLERIKQADKLISQLPSLCNMLSAHSATTNCKIIIIGRGRLKSKLMEVLNSIQSPACVEFVETNNPIPYLRRSKIFLSLQKDSNYPSRSLLEAIACGCIPIATKTADTDLIYDDSEHLIPVNFTSQTLFRKVVSIILKNQEQLSSCIAKYQDKIRCTFDLNSHVDYYDQIINQEL